MGESLQRCQSRFSVLVKFGDVLEASHRHQVLHCDAHAAADKDAAFDRSAAHSGEHTEPVTIQKTDILKINDYGFGLRRIHALECHTWNGVDILKGLVR